MIKLLLFIPKLFSWYLRQKKIWYKSLSSLHFDWLFLIFLDSSLQWYVHPQSSLLQYQMNNWFWYPRTQKHGGLLIHLIIHQNNKFNTAFIYKLIES